ncbi:hypothetical protein [Rhodothermus profundi]|uniref:Uncharacterized protein n=1 Tax=Rhodothermus profundi TaxID=633813 RepID=A0A1M6WGY5_9BACT|nr:hypothetical protein [Rhodothermus profundi]SHK92785.1 hypothetical protein SAMN04488087_2321 [Rhodothermus profundi]
MQAPSGSRPYLFQTPHGYVLRCACCGRFEVAFGRLVLQLSPERFQALCERVRSVPLEAWEAGSLCALSLTGRLETVDVRYACTHAELRALRELLEGAQAKMEREHLLQQALRARN